MHGLDPQHYLFQPCKEPSTALAIAFLNKSRSGDFEGAEVFVDAPFDVLIVNSHRLPWHGAKLDDLLNEIPVAQAEIGLFLDILKPTKLYCFGASLSGFPAIYMGAAFGADRILALAPDLVIGGVGTRSEHHLRGRPTTFPHPDLTRYLADFSIKNLSVIVGELDAADVFFSSLLRPLPGVDVHAVARISHQVFAHLKGKNAVLPLLLSGDIAASGTALGIRWSSILDSDVPRVWFDGIKSLKAQNFEAAEQDFRDVLRAMPDNHVAAEHLVDALRFQSRYVEALEVVDRVASKFPPKGRIHRIRERLVTLAKRQRSSQKEQAIAAD